MKFLPEDSIIRHCENLLSFIHSNAPGLTDLAILLARIHYLKADFSAALRILEANIEAERFGAQSGVFVMAAEVFLMQGNLQKAKTAMDRAIANSFTVKASLVFICLQAKYHRAAGAVNESTSVLR